MRVFSCLALTGSLYLGARMMHRTGLTFPCSNRHLRVHGADGSRFREMQKGGFTSPDLTHDYLNRVTIRAAIAASASSAPGRRSSLMGA